MIRYLKHSNKKTYYKIYLCLLAIVCSFPVVGKDVPLCSSWNRAAADNFSTTNLHKGCRGFDRLEINESNPHNILNGTIRDGYSLYRLEGFIYEAFRPQPSRTVPLFTWFNPQRQDYFTTSDNRWTVPLSEIDYGAYGYDRLVRARPIPNPPSREGYILKYFEGYVANPRYAQPEGTVPLFSWWNPSRGDNFTTSDPRWSMPVEEIQWRGEHIINGPLKDGYRLYRLEGFVWVSSSESETPPPRRGLLPPPVRHVGGSGDGGDGCDDDVVGTQCMGAPPSNICTSRGSNFSVSGRNVCRNGAIQCDTSTSRGVSWCDVGGSPTCGSLGSCNSHQQCTPGTSCQRGFCQRIIGCRVSPGTCWLPNELSSNSPELCRPSGNIPEVPGDYTTCREEEIGESCTTESFRCPGFDIPGTIICEVGSLTRQCMATAEGLASCDEKRK